MGEPRAVDPRARRSVRSARRLLWLILFLVLGVGGGAATLSLFNRSDVAEQTTRSKQNRALIRANREAINGLCKVLPIIIEDRKASLDPKIVAGILAPLRERDPVQFDKTLDKSRERIRRYERAERELRCGPTAPESSQPQPRPPQR